MRTADLHCSDQPGSTARKSRAREFYRRRQEAKASRTSCAPRLGAIQPYVEEPHVQSVQPRVPGRPCQMDVNVRCPGDMEVRPEFTMHKTPTGSIMVNVRLDLIPNPVPVPPPQPADPAGYLPYSKPQELEFPSSPEEMLKLFPFFANNGLITATT